MPVNAANSRALRASALHASNKSVLETMLVLGKNRVSLEQRRNFLRSIVDLKRNNAVYDFGPTQTKLLDILINKTRKAKTYDNWIEIHKLTCLLGLKKQ